MQVIYFQEWQVRQILRRLKVCRHRFAITKLTVGFAARIGRLEYSAARIQPQEDDKPHYDLMICANRGPEEYVLVATTPFTADWPEIREVYDFFMTLYGEQHPEDLDIAPTPSGKLVCRPRYPGTPLRCDDTERPVSTGIGALIVGDNDITDKFTRRR